MYHLKFHHLGIPTDRDLPKEDYIEELKCYASGFSSSPYGIEWMKYDPDCLLPDLVKSVPHLAFVTDNLAEAIKGKTILIRPNSPTKELTVAFIIDNGAPVELMQFNDPVDEIWPKNALYR